MVFAAIRNYNSLTPIIISAFIDISYWEHKAANLPRDSRRYWKQAPRNLSYLSITRYPRNLKKNFCNLKRLYTTNFGKCWTQKFKNSRTNIYARILAPIRSPCNALTNLFTRVRRSLKPTLKNHNTFDNLYPRVFSRKKRNVAACASPEHNIYTTWLTSVRPLEKLANQCSGDTEVLCRVPASSFLIYASQTNAN